MFFYFSMFLRARLKTGRLRETGLERGATVYQWKEIGLDRLLLYIAIASLDMWCLYGEIACMSWHTFKVFTPREKKKVFKNVVHRWRSPRTLKRKRGTHRNAKADFESLVHGERIFDAYSMHASRSLLLWSIFVLLSEFHPTFPKSWLVGWLVVYFQSHNLVPSHDYALVLTGWAPQPPLAKSKFHIKN